MSCLQVLFLSVCNQENLTTPLAWQATDLCRLRRHDTDGTDGKGDGLRRRRHLSLHIAECVTMISSFKYRVGQEPCGSFPPSEPYVKLSLHTAQAFPKATLIRRPAKLPQAVARRIARADSLFIRRASLLCRRVQK